MTKTYFLLVIAFMMSCTVQREKEVPQPEVDRELPLYSDVLEQLVTRRFYNLYLGSFDDLYAIKENDTAIYQSALNKLRILVESDSNKRRTICMTDTLFFGPWDGLLRMDSSYAHQLPMEYSQLMMLVSDDTLAIRHTLEMPQTKYKSKDFHSSAFRIRPSTARKDCEIGVVAFSKGYFNASNNKAILYYEFYCGFNCGKGELLYVELKHGCWTIGSTERLWTM